MLDEHKKICNKIKRKLNIKLYSMLVYDEKYIIAKVREFDGMIKTNFLGNKVLKKHTLYLHSLHNYQFCYENSKKELSTSFFKRMQIQNDESTQIHKH